MCFVFLLTAKAAGKAASSAGTGNGIKRPAEEEPLDIEDMGEGRHAHEAEGEEKQVVFRLSTRRPTGKLRKTIFGTSPG